MENVIELVLRQAVSVTAVVASYIVAAIQYAFANYPAASRVVVIIISAYVALKVARRLVAIYWLAVKTMLKMVFVTVLTLLVFAVYLRGPTRFFYRDIPFLYDLYRTPDEEAEPLFSYGKLLSDAKVDINTVKNYAQRYVAENPQVLDTFKRNARGTVQSFLQGRNLNGFMNN